MFSKATLKKIVSATLNDNDTICFLDNSTCKKYKKYFAKHKVYSIESLNNKRNSGNIKGIKILGNNNTVEIGATNKNNRISNVQISGSNNIIANTITGTEKVKHKKYYSEIDKGNGTAIIFIESYNDTSILQANKVAKIFKDSEKYAKVFVLALECSKANPVPLYAILNEDNMFGSWNDKTQRMENACFDVLITTNSTGVLQPQNIEGLIVVDISQEIQKDSTIDLIITSVGIIDKLCLKVKSLFSIKKK